MIDAFKTKFKITIYIDHAAITSIVKATKLISNSTNKLNLRLIRVSTYLSQYDLNIWHRSGNQHVVLDALSRLKSLENFKNSTEDILDSNYDEFTEISVYHITLVEMTDSFKTRLKDEYLKNKRWKRILELLLSSKSVELTTVNSDDTTNSDYRLEDLQFRLRNDLIYYVEFVNEREQLCIFRSMTKEVFELTHDRQSHVKYHRIYANLASSIYIRKMSSRLQKYIQHCSQCQLNSTKRHSSYEFLRSITSSIISFHTISMNFILALSIISEEYDTLLTITDKFSKRVLLISDKETFDASNWANIVLIALMSHDWSISRAIISDRDSKFMSSFWRKLFQLLDTKLLVSTIYHSQIDEFFERTNQIVELAFRFYLIFNSIDDFTMILSYIQTILNNSISVTTEVSSNEILYEFRTNDTLSMLTNLISEDWSRLRQVKREQVEEAIAWANIVVKSNYDRKHTAVDLQKDFMIYLRFHKGYTISELKNRKLINQRVRLFKILQKIESFIYRLNLLFTMRIHSVVFIAQLKSILFNEDLYRRSRQNESSSVEAEDDESESKYEVKRILNKRYNRQRKNIEYLIKWMSYHDEWNTWHILNDLENVTKAIQNYENIETRKSMIRRRKKEQILSWYEIIVLQRNQESYFSIRLS